MKTLIDYTDKFIGWWDSIIGGEERDGTVKSSIVESLSTQEFKKQIATELINKYYVNTAVVNKDQDVTFNTYSFSIYGINSSDAYSKAIDLTRTAYHSSSSYACYIVKGHYLNKNDEWVWYGVEDGE